MDWNSVKERWQARLHHGLSWIMGQVATCEIPWIKNALNRRFIKIYELDLAEAQAGEKAEDYPSLQALFTRKLKASARPVGEGWVSPADGFWGMSGIVDPNRTLIQAKGQSYGLSQLLGSDQWDEKFEDASYFTIYLAPKNYHRVHLPFAGALTDMVHVGGTLFPVRPATTARVQHLFARNERVITVFQTEQGPMAVVFVGALCVGSVSCVWHGPVVPGHLTAPHQTHWRYESQPSFKKAEEIGHFSFGSTVVVIAPPHFKLLDFPVGSPIKMGEQVGRPIT